MEEQQLPSSQRRRNRTFPKYLIPIFGILLLLVTGVAAFFGGRMSVYTSHPELTQAEEAKAILEKVGKLIKLPEGELPSMATIEDAEGVKAGQPFLSNAENGDVLIVYNTTATAILYRPSSNLLIAVGPVNMSSPEEQATEIMPEAETEAEGAGETEVSEEITVE